MEAEAPRRKPSSTGKRGVSEVIKDSIESKKQQGCARRRNGTFL